MQPQELNQLPGQRLRSGAIGRIGMIFCLLSLLSLAAIVLLKPG